MRVGDVICLKNNELNDALRKGFFDLSPKAGDIIVADVGGGDLDMAMDMGDFIYEHDNLVVVDGVCFSACANHLALGAKRLALIHDGVLSFHRGPASDQAIMKVIPSAYQPEWLRISHRGFRFFARRGIDPELTFMPPEKYWDKSPEYWWMNGWIYSVAEMKKFGVNNVVYCQGISCKAVLNEPVKGHPFKRPEPAVFGPPQGWKPTTPP